MKYECEKESNQKSCRQMDSRQMVLLVQVDTLRKSFKEFQSKGEIKILLTAIEKMREKFGSQPVSRESHDSAPSALLNRQDLRLICFELISGG